FYRRFAAEHRDQHLHFAARFVHLADFAVELFKRPVDDTDLVAHGEVDGVLNRALGRLHAAQEDRNLVVFERHRVDAGTDESGDARRVAHDVPRLVIYYHIHQHVAGVDLFLLLDAAAAFNLYRFLRRDDHLEYFIGESQRLDALFEVAG